MDETVTVERSGLIRVGDGAVVLYGPFTEDEREGLTRRIVAALRYDPAAHVPENRTLRSAACRMGAHVRCSGWRETDGRPHGPSAPCECPHHGAS